MTSYVHDGRPGFYLNIKLPETPMKTMQAGSDAARVAGEAVAPIDKPIVDDFWEGVRVEREYQQQRWGTVDERNKAPADWFWLVGYLAGKALAAHVLGDAYKARHHTISTAAALSHWFDAIARQVDMKRSSDLEKAIGVDAGQVPT